MKEIIADKQKEYQKRKREKLETYKRDKRLTEYAQTRWEYHKALGSSKRADFYDWVLELVDKLEEAEYDKEMAAEQLQERDEYIRELELEVGDNTWKETWYKR